ncbi:MAG: hypothetical protein WD490_06435, partial [Opitutales bacterium]
MNSLSLTTILAPLTALLLPSSALAFDLYWTEQLAQGDVIMGSTIDGHNAVTVFDGAGMAPDAVIVDLAITDTHLYWSANADSDSAGGIWRSNRDGSSAERLVPTAGNFTQPHFLAIDEGNNALYFSDYSGGIFQARLTDGGDLTTVVASSEGGTPPNFTGLAFRDADRLLFFSSGNNSLYDLTVGGFSWWLELTGFSLPGGAATYGMAFDPDTQTAYYTDFEEGTLRSFKPDSLDAGFLAAGLQSPLGVKLSPSKTHLLVLERGGGVLAYQ